ncbi:MAG: hypothetical protein WA791_14375, partial [Rhodomicrobium sp.]
RISNRFGNREALRERIMNRLENRGEFGDTMSERGYEPEEQGMDRQAIRDLILDEAMQGGSNSALNRLRDRLGGKG